MFNIMSRQWITTFVVIIFYKICVIKCNPLTIISNYPELQNNEHLIHNDVPLAATATATITTSRPSKLRQLLLKSLEPVEAPSSLVVDVNCSSEVTLGISTRLCSCKNQLCFNLSGKVNNKTRIIEKSCHDYCCNQKRNYKTKTAQKQITDKCGIFNISSNPIFPWVVKLLLKRSDSPICIGSLIHPRVVLTNVVCVFMQLNSQIRARLGDTSVSNTYEDRQIVDKIIHEKFSDSYEELGNNIALLILDRPFAVNNKWSSIACLPQPDFIFDDKNCFISSWEKDPVHNKITPKTQTVAVHSLTKCQHEYRNSKRKYESHMHDGNICATSKTQQDINIKSSGAPIYCDIQHPTNNESHYVQIGVLAWSTSVSRPPHIVTNVATYRNWIQKHLSHFDN